ncbi:CO/xanthine dehydrogenase FAD-binding subunit [Rhodococcus erythropolis]|nr:CO/xanthine dehydrogenase FAD-binding subunit [Rhodococcus erythropolis]
MDLHSVDEVLVPRTRAELPCASPGIGFIGGGTWLYSEPQPHLTTLVDLAGFDWKAVAVGDLGLEIAATCTIEELCRADLPTSWSAAALFQHCADALLASWKVLRYATVGGNIALSFPAGAMTTLCTALDAELTIWRPDGTEYSVPVVDFVIDDSRNVLGPGEIIRSIRIPVHALTARTAMRKLAQTSLGRSAVSRCRTLRCRRFHTGDHRRDPPSVRSEIRRTPRRRCACGCVAQQDSGRRLLHRCPWNCAVAEGDD